jgi:hypothetical protein
MNSYGSLAESARGQKLKSAKGIFWVIGVLMILLHVFPLLDIEKTVDDEIDKALVAQHAGVTVAQVRSRPEALRAEFEQERTKAIQKAKLLYGASVAMGLVFIACALFINRKPVIATVTGLVLYLGITAAILAFNPDALTGNPVGLGLRVAIIIGMIGAVKTALAVERQERMERDQAPA